MSVINTVAPNLRSCQMTGMRPNQMASFNDITVQRIDMLIWRDDMGRLLAWTDKQCQACEAYEPVVDAIPPDVQPIPEEMEVKEL